MEPEPNAGEDKEYKVKTIKDSAVYTNAAMKNQLLELYYFISWISYSKDKNIKKPAAGIMHLWKIINTFHKNHPEEPTATSLLFDSASPMAKLII